MHDQRRFFADQLRRLGDGAGPRDLVNLFEQRLLDTGQWADAHDDLAHADRAVLGGEALDLLDQRLANG